MKCPRLPTKYSLEDASLLSHLEVPPKLSWLRAGSFWVHFLPDTKGTPFHTPHPTLHCSPHHHDTT